MATGDITDEYDGRLSPLRSLPVCGLTLEIVVASGDSTAEVVLDEVDHPCMNCLLVDAYLEFPAIATAAKTVKFEILTERDNICFSTGDLDATVATDTPYHWEDLQRAIRGKTALKITCDAVVASAKAFYIGLRGV